MAVFLDPAPSNYRSEAIRVVKSVDLNQDAATPVLDVVPAPPATEPFQRLQAVVNADADVSGVKVQLWAMAFGTGTTPYLDSMGGPGGVEIPAGAGFDLTAGTQRAFARDWNQSHGLSATDPEIQPLLGPNNEFHCCIKANTFVVDAEDNVIEGARLGPSPIINFNDPHQAQRNMTIKTHASGTAMMMLMFAGNIDEERERPARLLVRDRAPRRLTRNERAQLGAMAPWIRRSAEEFGPLAVPGLEVLVNEERVPIRFAEQPLDELQLEIGRTAGPELKLKLRPKEPRRMMLQATLPKEDFVLRRLDIAQIEEDEVVGEAHILLLSAPAELLEKPREPGYAQA